MIFKKDISNKTFWLFIGLLIVLRVLMVVFLFFDIPPANFQSDTFSFGAGDEGAYFAIAKNLTQFKIEPDPSQISIGLPLYLSPFIAITKAQSFYDINKLTLILMAFVLFSISIILVSLIAKFLFKNKLLGLLVGVVYSFYPYLLYFLNLGPYQKNWGNFIDAMWLRGALTDGLSAFLIYLTIYLLLKVSEKGKTINPIFTGITAGLASLVRVTNLIFVFVFGIYLLVQKKNRELIIMLFLAILVFTPQLVYNFYAHDSWLSFGDFSLEREDGLLKDDYYLYQMGTIAQLKFTPHNYLYFLTVLDKYIPYLPLVLFCLVSFIVLAFWYIFKINKKTFYFVILWLFPFAAFYASFHSAARNIRYWLPIIPVVIIIIICGLLSINYFIKNARKLFRQ